MPLRLSGLGGTRVCHLQSLLSPARVKPGPPGLFEMLSRTHDVIDQPPGSWGWKVLEAQHRCPYLGTLTLRVRPFSAGGLSWALQEVCTQVARSTFLSPPL